MKELTMLIDFLMTYLIKPATQFPNKYGTEVDRYVASKYPKTVADVEHWEKEYNRKQQLGRTL